MISNQVTILKDWGDALAIFKPAGWLTIPGRGIKEGVPILSHILGAQLREGRKKGKESDLFVVHRLDEGTSGVILFTRTSQAHRELSLLFEGHDVKKTYWCGVKNQADGALPVEQLIDAPLFKIPSKKIKSVVDPKGKPSKTLIKTISSKDGFSLVEATPLTGRSHQIRVHLAHIGFPLLGDKLYGGSPEGLKMSFPYPLLHAREIQFLWKDELRVAKAPLQGEFLKLTQALEINLDVSPT